MAAVAKSADVACYTKHCVPPNAKSTFNICAARARNTTLRYAFDGHFHLSRYYVTITGTAAESTYRLWSEKCLSAQVRQNNNWIDDCRNTSTRNPCKITRTGRVCSCALSVKTSLVVLFFLPMGKVQSKSTSGREAWSIWNIRTLFSTSRTFILGSR